MGMGEEVPSSSKNAKAQQIEKLIKRERVFKP
jgi:hypothetical protein